MKNLFNFSGSNIPSITRFLSMYIQLPSRFIKTATLICLCFWAFLGLSTQAISQCSLAIESVSHLDTDCGQNNGRAEVIPMGGTAPITFAWSNAATTQSITGLTAGAYTVTISDASGCNPIITTVLVNNNNGPVLSAISNTAATCSNSNGSIGFNLAGSNPFSITWSGAANGTLTGQGTSVSITALPAGDYIVRATDATGCSTLFMTTVVRGGAITATTSIQTQPTCAGGANGVIRLQATSGTLPFEFFINGVSQGIFNSNIFDYTSLTAGTYTVATTDGNGCMFSTSITLDEAGSTALNPADFTITGTTCPGGADGSISSATCPTCEVYDASGTLVANLAAPITTLTAGNYEVRLASGGCVSSMPFVIVSPAAWSFSAVVDNSGCITGSIDVTVSAATAPYSFLWSTGATTEDVNLLTPGSYAVTITDAQSCQLVRSNMVVDYCSSIDTVAHNLYVNSVRTVCVDTTGLPGTLVSVANLNCSTLNNGSVTNINSAAACISYTAGNVAGSGDQVCVQICDNLGFCDTTIIYFTVVPKPDTAIIMVPAGSGVVDTCPINIQFAGPLASVTDMGCDVNNVGGISVNPTNGCVSYTPPTSVQNSGVRSDTVCVQLCDLSGVCDTMVYIFHNQEPLCINLLPNNNIVRQLTDCANISVCVPTIPRDSAQSGQYSFQVNGLNYSGGFGICNQVTRIQYPFVLIPGCVDSFAVTWVANGVLYGPANVVGLNGIINFMNFNDGNTAWTLSGSNIAVGTNTNNSTNYGNLSVTCYGSGAVTNMGPTVQPQYSQGVELGFATQGTYNLVVTGPLNCKDTTNIIVYCAQTDVFADTILVGGSATFCLDVTEVPSVDTVINFCEVASTGSVRFLIDQATACVTYIGDSIGSDIGCFIVCSSNGVCDTTYIFIDVALPRPIAVDDSISIPYGQLTDTINVCTNDTFDPALNTIVIIQQPSKGRVLQNGCTVFYTLINGECGDDFFDYIVYNAWGADTARVYVTSACDPFIIYDGFSPNGDGFNDFLVIRTISDFPGNEVVVFNRWGLQVFKARDYQNDWDGRFNGGDLPDGYYYVMVSGANGEVLGRKWILIQR